MVDIGLEWVSFILKFKCLIVIYFVLGGIIIFDRYDFWVRYC